MRGDIKDARGVGRYKVVGTGGPRPGGRKGGGIGRRIGEGRRRDREIDSDVSRNQIHGI